MTEETTKLTLMRHPAGAMELMLLACLLCIPQCSSYTIKSEGNGFRIRELTKVMVRFKMVKNEFELCGVPFGFTIKDSASKPVPNSILLLKYADRTDSFPADLTGEALFVLDSTMLQGNPLICAAGKNQWPDLSMRMSFTLGEKLQKTNLVRLDSLQRIETVCGLVYYPRGCEPVAQRLADYLPKAAALIARLTGFQPVDFAIALVDKPEPVIVTPDRARVADRTYTLEPSSLVTDSGADRYLSNLHEWTEATIRTSFAYCEPMPRWIYEGLATYSEYRMLVEFDTTDPVRPRLVASAEKQFGHAREWLGKQQARGKKTVGVGLLAWKEPGPQQPMVETEIYKYQLSFWFWWKVSQRYGEKGIADFLTRAKQAKVRDNAGFLKVLGDCTGNPRIADWLKSADIAETIAMIDEYLAAVKAE
ncbi:MAG: hypothetical protein NTX53_09545 [candidate division WOR-3 bacterium]|nr:hypothetical protein [candidate division WOR-3 bacterium]